MKLLLYRAFAKHPHNFSKKDQNYPIVCEVLVLDSWNYYSGEQAQQPNIWKIV